jgi:hypothetical protein
MHTVNGVVDAHPSVPALHSLSVVYLAQAINFVAPAMPWAALVASALVVHALAIAM